MIVIYHCYGSAHSSVTAAGIHLGFLPRDRRPTRSEILAVPRFDRTLTRELGTPFFMGTDRLGHRVYILGRANGARMMGNLLRSLQQLYGRPLTDVLFVNALPQLTLTTTVGGTLSRGYGFVWPGRPMTIAGIRMCYFRFVKLIEETEALIATMDNAKKETAARVEN